MIFFSFHFIVGDISGPDPGTICGLQSHLELNYFLYSASLISVKSQVHFFCHVFQDRLLYLQKPLCIHLYHVLRNTLFNWVFMYTDLVTLSTPRDL